MISADPAEQVLHDLTRCLERLKAIDARIAAAYLDMAIEALCRERQISRNPSKTD